MQHVRVSRLEKLKLPHVSRSGRVSSGSRDIHSNGITLPSFVFLLLPSEEMRMAPNGSELKMDWRRKMVIRLCVGEGICRRGNKRMEETRA